MESKRGLILAADFLDSKQVLNLATTVKSSLSHVKLHATFVLKGPRLLRSLQKEGLKVFLDLKFHDIPNTMRLYIKVAADMGVSMLTVHTSAGENAIELCAEEAYKIGKSAPQIIAVTSLTSLDDESLATLGVSHSRSSQVARLASVAERAGADGVVCSVPEANSIRETCKKDFVIVTPGVRLQNSSVNEHVGVGTPKEAILAGANYLVVGRPIYTSEAPKQVCESIVNEMNSVFK